MRALNLVLILILIISCQQRQLHERQGVQNNEDRQEPGLSEQYGSEDFGILLKRYEDPARELWQNPELVVEKMGDLRGKVVADIGVGTGYFTFKVANDAEKVIAIDVENKFLEYIEERKFELGGASIVSKIETRLCKPDDPLLNDEEANVVLLIDTYHFIQDRLSYMQNVYGGLSDNGFVMLVDYKEGNMPVGPPEERKIKLGIALDELRGAGFSISEIDTTSLQFQYLVKATK